MFVFLAPGAIDERGSWTCDDDSAERPRTPPPAASRRTTLISERHADAPRHHRTTGYVEFNITGSMSLARLCGRPACRSGISLVVYGFGGSGVPHNRGCASRLLGSSSAI